MIKYNFLKTALTFLLILVASEASLGTERSILSFAKEIEVSRRTKIYLADVVSVTNPSREINNAIKNIVLLDWDMSIGAQKELSNFHLSKILKKITASHNDLKELNPIFKIPNSVTFRMANESIVSKDEIKNRLDQLFKIRCAQCEFEYTLKNKININQLLWAIDYSNVDLKSSILLPVVQGEYKSFRWLTVGVRIQAPALVATRNLSMGQRISETDFQNEVREVRDIGERVQNISDFVGSKLVRPMRAGEVLIERIVRREPLTRRGNLVKTIIGNETYELQSQFIAQEDGFRNDIIKIKNPDTGRILSATIVDQDVVKVRE